jgi:hypothetical protein
MMRPARTNKNAGRKVPSGAELFRLSVPRARRGEGVRREEPKKSIYGSELILRNHFLFVAVAGSNFIGSEHAVASAER